MAKIVTTSQAATGDPVEATLDKNELKLVSKVANDAVFSQESNWGLVSCIFKHKDSARRFVAAFKGSETEIMNLKPSMLAGDNFELKKIIVAKPNRELLVVNKPEIPSYADYDFTLKGSNTGNYINYNVLSSGVTTNSSGAVIVPSGTDYYSLAKATGTSYLGLDFSFTFNIEPTLPYNFLCAVSDLENEFQIGSYAVGFLNLGDPTSVVVYANGSIIGTSIALLPSGNVLKIERISGNINLYVNDINVHTVVGYNPIFETFPCVRPVTGTIVTSSSVVTPAPASVLYNPLEKGDLITLSNGDLTATQLTYSGGSNNQVYLTPSFPFASGKKYIEFSVDNNNSNNTLIVGASVANDAPTYFTSDPVYYFGSFKFAFLNSGYLYINSQYISTGYTFTTGDVLMLAIDLDNKKIWLGKNGSWFESQNPETNTGGGDISSLSGLNVYLGISFHATLGGQVSIITSPSYKPSGFTNV